MFVYMYSLVARSLQSFSLFAVQKSGESLVHNFVCDIRTERMVERF